MGFVPCYFSSHLFNICVPVGDEVDLLFCFLDISYWYMGVYCLYKENMGRCRIREFSLLVCSGESLGFGDTWPSHLQQRVCALS